MSYTLADIVGRFGGDLLGDGSIRIRQVAELERAAADEIGFVAQPKYISQLEHSQAGAVILPRDAADATTRPRIVTDNPYLYFARVSRLLNPLPAAISGVHPTAVVGANVRLGTDVSVGAGAVIADNAIIGARTRIGAHTVIGENTRIGEDCVLHANVTIYPACIIGNRAILHAGCVVGSDGFGFASNEGRWEKIPQIGRVLIGDDVEIGAGTTIDRGALGDTVIEEGVKLDNLIQIAHNVFIGAHTAIAACTGIAGSARIGRHCTIGGAAMIFGHIEIADGTRISTNTLITKSLKTPGTYTSALPFTEHEVWLKNAVHLRKLADSLERIKTLEARIAALEHAQGEGEKNQ